MSGEKTKKEGVKREKFGKCPLNTPPTGEEKVGRKQLYLVTKCYI